MQSPVTGISTSGERCTGSRQPRLPEDGHLRSWAAHQLPSDLLPQRQVETPALTPGNEQLCVRQAARQRQQAWLK